MIEAVSTNAALGSLSPYIQAIRADNTLLADGATRGKNH